jgi:hypothetical protein
MGLLGKMLNKALPGVRMQDPVRGQAQVVACSDYHGRGINQSCTMELVVQGDGVPPTRHQHLGLVHRDKWPAPGMALPITIDRADPAKMYILWDEVQNSRERDAQAAEALAAQMRRDGAPPDA